MVQTWPLCVSQPVQPANVEPFGVAVRVTGVPVTNAAVHVLTQLRPGGELVTVPAPVPAKVTVRRDPDPVPVKQITFAVIVPVTTAPEDDMLPELLFVVTVAEINELPHS